MTLASQNDQPASPRTSDEADQRAARLLHGAGVESGWFREVTAGAAPEVAGRIGELEHEAGG